MSARPESFVPHGTPRDVAAPRSAVAPATARAELRWAADTLLKVHPALTRAPARAALERTLAAQEARLGAAPTRDDVAIALQLLLASLGDPHTTAAPQATSARVLPVVFFAVSDAILVSPVTGVDTGLPDVARLVRLGGLTPTQLLDRLRQLVPGNDAWVRYRLGRIVDAEDVLRWLGVLEDSHVAISVERPDGTRVTASVPLEPATALAHRSAPVQALLQRATGMTGAWTHRGETYLWRVDGADRTGIFWLLSCVDSADYRAAVAAFFAAVHGAGATRVVLDLRFDGGGNSNVAVAFLMHLPARTIDSYGVEVRASGSAAQQRGADAAALAGAATGRDGALLVMQRPGADRARPARGLPTRPPALTTPGTRGTADHGGSARRGRGALFGTSPESAPRPSGRPGQQLVQRPVALRQPRLHAVDQHGVALVAVAEARDGDQPGSAVPEVLERHGVDHLAPRHVVPAEGLHQPLRPGHLQVPPFEAEVAFGGVLHEAPAAAGLHLHALDRETVAAAPPLRHQLRLGHRTPDALARGVEDALHTDLGAARRAQRVGGILRPRHRGSSFVRSRNAPSRSNRASSWRR